jgi:ABC-type Fe3+ transport system substrate-binding protein
MMIRWKQVGVVTMMFGAVAFGNSPTIDAAEIGQMINVARKEATEGVFFVSITQPNQDRTYAALFDAFRKQFNINVQYEWQAHQQDYYVRVIAEADAGRRTPDVISGSPANMLALDKAGLVDPYDWTKVFGKEMPRLSDSVARTIPALRGKSLAHFDVIYTMVYNSKLISTAEVPRMLEDLLEPKWQRKLVVNAQGSPFTTLGIALGREEVLEMVRKLKANRPILKRGAPGVVAAVAVGEAPLGFGYTTGAEVEKAKGAPIDWVPLKDYVPVLQQNLTVLKTTQRPNLARLFVAWAVSDGMDLQERLEFMGRATARGTRTWQRLNDMSPKAHIVEEKTAAETTLRGELTKEITRIFTQ